MVGMTTGGISSSHPRGLQLAAGTTGCSDRELDDASKNREHGKGQWLRETDLQAQ